MSDYNWCHGPECHTQHTQSRVRGSGDNKVLRTIKIKWGRYNYSGDEQPNIWDYFCGNRCLTFLDLDATERYGKDQYRNATDKITPWSIK